MLALKMSILGGEMEIVRFVKIFLVLCVGLWGLLGTIGNLSNLADVYNEVRNVTSMSGVPEEVGPPWRTTNPLVVWAGVIAIVLGKLAAVAGGYGGLKMLQHVNAAPAEFNKSKQWAIAGCGLAFAIMMFSFTIVAETAFFMFYTPRFEGAAALAFRLGGSFALITLLVAQPEPD